MWRFITGLVTVVAVTLSSQSQAQPYKTIAAKLADDLVTQINQVDDSYSQLGITRWVMADSLALPSAHDSVARLSHELSETLYTRLKERQVRLIDYRAQDYVSLHAHGSTLLSRDPEKLNTAPHLDWVLVGTLAREPKGVMVNLRVVDRTSQQVLAAANQFVPKHEYVEHQRSEIIDNKLQRNY